MLSKEILDLVLEESETMIIEWADAKDGFGLDKIKYKIHTYFQQNKGFPQSEQEKIIKNVRKFIKTDMELIGW